VTGDEYAVVVTLAAQTADCAPYITPLCAQVLRGVPVPQLVTLVAPERGASSYIGSTRARRASRSVKGVRTVQVCRHRRDTRQAVLTANGLQLYDPGDLGDRTGVVRPIQMLREQGVLDDALGGELWVDAGGAGEQHPLDFVVQRRVQHLDLDAYVVADEVDRAGVSARMPPTFAAASATSAGPADLSPCRRRPASQAARPEPNSADQPSNSRWLAPPSGKRWTQHQERASWDARRGTHAVDQHLVDDPLPHRLQPRRQSE
jgi:hypothetical protein